MLSPLRVPVAALRSVASGEAVILIVTSLALGMVGSWIAILIALAMLIALAPLRARSIKMASLTLPTSILRAAIPADR